jgi:hypothetical protein
VTRHYPRITNPWAVEYLLVDGKFHSDSNCYSAMICANPQNLRSKALDRPRAMKSLLPQNTPIVPSSLGEHNSSTLTLQPEYVYSKQVLLLLSIIQFSTKSCQLRYSLGILEPFPSECM